MKLPALRFDKDALGAFLLRHVEKFVGAVVAVGAVLLLWNGIESIRSRSVRSTERPESIQAEVTRADAHIQSLSNPPDELLPASTPLADMVAPWLDAKPASAPPLVALDKPLFPEFSRRSQPDILPAEGLQAVAGIAVFPRAAVGNPAGEAGGFVGDSQPGTPGRITPYVVVTGLIPIAAQRDEYRRRFADAGYQDARRDVPLWSDFELERCTVSPQPGGGQDGPWRPIDLVKTARIQSREWTAPQPLPVPTDYLLQATDERRSRETPLDFAGLLPQRIDRPWGTETIHPWVLADLRRSHESPRPANEVVDEPTAPVPEPDTAIFGDRESEVRPRIDGRTSESAAPGQPPQEERPPPDFRVFAFVDTNVEPNTAYRYRLRLKVWNPNLGLPRQHLVDPAIAKEQRLASPLSSPTAAVRVPDPQVLLVDVVPATEIKKLRLKPGVLEVLVLDASADTGNYALRSALIDIGGLANVEKRLNRPGETRARGEDAITDRLLVDVLGQQVEGDDKPRRGPRVIPEPFMALFLRPDGSFEQVTAAASEPLIDRYRDTLPERDVGRRDTRPAGPAGEFEGFPGAPGFPGGQGPRAPGFPDSPFPPRR
jgi:hypothetical protein